MVHFLSRMENEVIEKPEDPQNDRFHAIAAAPSSHEASAENAEKHPYYQR